MMASLINQDVVDKAILKVISEDINDVLDKETERVIRNIQKQIKEKVAARLIALAGSEYNFNYNQQELCIRVKMEMPNDPTI